ncbi:hypothetical protein HY994_00350 [Candidatus Micrarchaeota archaeon]|nr:hypothetical protein [Candidatus Micrarchaeota archaeon]
MEYATAEEKILLRQLRRDSDWMSVHYKELLEQFDGQFIAVKDEKVVVADASHDHMLDRLKTLGFNPALVLVTFLTSRSRVLTPM